MARQEQPAPSITERTPRRIWAGDVLSRVPFRGVLVSLWGGEQKRSQLLVAWSGMQ